MSHTLDGYDWIMTTQAKATFTLGSWEEKPYRELEGGTKFTRTTYVQQMSGDLEGESVTDSLMYYREDGTAAYTDLSRFEGRIGDRSGSFVYAGSGAYDGEKAEGEATIVTGSGTGDLGGITGTTHARAAAGSDGGSFTVDYDLG
jgi:Protein of unknown function (DUF3224)